MRLPLKYIFLLVFTSLTALFCYQVYWLADVFRIQNAETEKRINEAITTSDMKEMIHRLEKIKEADKVHGEIKIDMGRGKKDTTLIKVVSRPESIGATTHPTTFIKQTQVGNQKLTSVLVAEQATIKKNVDFEQMNMNFQQALHTGLESYAKMDINAYDSILCRQLAAYGIEQAHQIEVLHLLDGGGEKMVAKAASEGYAPTPKAKQFRYIADATSHTEYRLTMEPLTYHIFGQMRGIIVASSVILLITAFTFYYLIRTLFMQKTLEEMKNDFVNNVTHELKTPIAIAYAANDSLLNFSGADNPQKRQEYLAIGQEQLQKLGGMVEQILSMSAKRTRIPPLQKEDIALKPVLERLVAQYRLKADKPVEITLDVMPDTMTAAADPAHFDNMVGNLLDNAIKYSAEHADIQIICRHTDKPGYTAAISVADKGIGIPHDKQELIFDKFYRIHSGNLHDIKGYGLGLFYVKSIMERHGGTVTVASKPGKGSTFTLHFRP